MGRKERDFEKRLKDQGKAKMLRERLLRTERYQEGLQRKYREQALQALKEAQDATARDVAMKWWATTAPYTYYGIHTPTTQSPLPTSANSQGGNSGTMARKFKNGDGVMPIAEMDEVNLIGTFGVVMGYVPEVGGGQYAVDFSMGAIPPQLKGHLHDCWGHVPSGKGFFFDASTLEHAEHPSTAPKVKVDFQTVVIADEKRQQILEALEQINQQDLIFKVWGFDSTIEKGRGVSLLFYGPPGTGKTLMGQAIASKLNYTLKVISTADIESSAPGESERNIREIFKNSKGKKDILLFDECDSLIYTRQHVGPILGAQINELLSQLERFEGITIFTTNRLGTLDEAVNRRLALKLEFSMPSPAERAEIWKRMFPVEAPLAKDVDFKRLAVVEIAGGHIKNAVLRAARMAAIVDKPDSEKEITMAHLTKALTFEAESMMAFQKARKEHEGSFGHVDADGKVVRGTGRSFSNG